MQLIVHRMYPLPPFAFVLGLQIFSLSLEEQSSSRTQRLNGYLPHFPPVSEGHHIEAQFQERSNYIAFTLLLNNITRKCFFYISHKKECKKIKVRPNR